MKEVSYIYIVSTDTESIWTTELTLTQSLLAKVTQVLAILTKHQDLTFATVNNINISLRVKVYVFWFLELAWTITMGAK